MPYVSLDNLARFHGRLRDWASSEFASLDMANWQKTAAAGAVSFLPVPEMPLDPVVNFLFTESGPASGTKGPDNPSTITGVTQAKVTRCGKNLIPAASEGSTTVNEVTYTVDSNGVVTASGTASASASFVVVNRLFVPAGTYCLSGCPANGSAGTYSLSFHKWGGSASRDYGEGSVVTVSEAGEYQIYISVTSGVTVSNLVFRPQLELGSAVTAFEPYEGTDYTVNLGGTYYGGSVDLSAGTMTVTWGAKALNGSESFNKNNSNSTESISVFSGVFDIPQGTMSTSASSQNRVCSHFRYETSFEVGTFYTWATATNILFAMDATQYPTKESFASWLAAQNSNGTPVVVGYLLNTPYTVQLTPTQILSLTQPDPYNPRLNTVYSDQISVQVGYPKSPQATQNELTNAVVSLGGNL